MRDASRACPQMRYDDRLSAPYRVPNGQSLGTMGHAVLMASPQQHRRSYEERASVC